MRINTTNSNKQISIRLATLNDLEDIQSLNRKWTNISFETLTVDEKRNGFLDCESFSTEDLKKIILAQETAVGFLGETMIAYYINDNYSHLLDEYDDAIAELKAKNVIPNNARISKRTQIVVDQLYQRHGIPRIMLDFLKPHLIQKFDLLFSIGNNENPKRIAHEKSGWKIIYENSMYYYCAYDLTNRSLLANEQYSSR